MKTAFVTGITGQDGSYLSRRLINKNYLVYGYTRSKKKNNLKNLKKVEVINKIKIKKYEDKKPKLIISDIKR